MKDILILDCGPSLSDVSKNYGVAPEWIMRSLKGKGCSFNWVKAYEGDKFHSIDSDAWIITGSPRSVYEESDWMLDIED